MILVYIPAADVEAYISQGWLCSRLQGHHGNRGGGLYARARTFIAAWHP